MTNCQRLVGVGPTFDALTADVETIVAADLKDEALLGLGLHGGVSAPSPLVWGGGHQERPRTPGSTLGLQACRPWNPAGT